MQLEIQKRCSYLENVLWILSQSHFHCEQFLRKATIFRCFDVSSVRPPQIFQVQAKISTVRPVFPNYLSVSYDYVSYDVININILHHVLKGGKIVKTFLKTTYYMKINKKDHHKRITWNISWIWFLHSVQRLSVCTPTFLLRWLIKSFVLNSCFYVMQSVALKWDVIYLLNVHYFLVNWSISGNWYYICSHTHAMVSASREFPRALVMIWDFLIDFSRF